MAMQGEVRQGIILGARLAWRAQSRRREPDGGVLQAGPRFSSKGEAMTKELLEKKRK